MPLLHPLEQLDAARFDTPAILKKLASSSRRLAELKGIAASIPNQGILINTLGLQEAKDSSEIENIVTTHDELIKDDVLPKAFANPAAKEMLRYLQALRVRFEQVRACGLLTAMKAVFHPPVIIKECFNRPALGLKLLSSHAQHRHHHHLHHTGRAGAGVRAAPAAARWPAAGA